MPNLIKDFINSYGKTKLKNAILSELSTSNKSQSKAKAPKTPSVKSWIKAVRKAALLKKLACDIKTAAENKIKNISRPKQPKVKLNKQPKAPKQPKIKKASDALSDIFCLILGAA